MKTSITIICLFMSECLFAQGSRGGVILTANTDTVLINNFAMDAQWHSYYDQAIYFESHADNFFFQWHIASVNLLPGWTFKEVCDSSGQRNDTFNCASNIAEPKTLRLNNIDRAYLGVTIRADSAAVHGCNELIVHIEESPNYIFANSLKVFKFCNIIPAADSNMHADHDSMRSELQLYPNPVGSVLYFKTKTEILDLQFYNMTGHHVQVTCQKQSNNYYVADLSSIRSGIYFVKLRTAEKCFVEKVYRK